MVIISPLPGATFALRAFALLGQILLLLIFLTLLLKEKRGGALNLLGVFLRVLFCPLCREPSIRFLSPGKKLPASLAFVFLWKGSYGDQTVPRDVSSPDVPIIQSVKDFRPAFSVVGCLLQRQWILSCKINSIYHTSTIPPCHSITFQQNKPIYLSQKLPTIAQGE